jgi:hypothetical protein
MIFLRLVMDESFDAGLEILVDKILLVVDLVEKYNFGDVYE